jgi:hypothetical protein
LIERHLRVSVFPAFDEAEIMQMVQDEEVNETEELELLTRDIIPDQKKKYRRSRTSRYISFVWNFLCQQNLFKTFLEME